MKNFNFKKTLALTASALALSTAFVGCTDYIGLAEGELKMMEFNKQYDEEFVKLFGTPNPNQDWGLTELTPIQPSGGIGLRTRAESSQSQVMVNRNQWIERKDDQKYQSLPYHQRPYRDGTDNLAGYIQIPGWPHLNGLYYGSNGGGALEGALTPDQLDLKGNNWRPVGDVTEYEIQYVSAWFRTHPNPESISLHLSDFFIQNISQDDDQDKYDPISFDNTTWSNISNRKNGDNISMRSDASTYTNSHIWRKTGSSERINYSLDHLGFKDMDGNWTHVNNFNNQNSNYNPEESNDNPQREIKYIKSAGTEDFECHPSWNTDATTDVIKSWVLVHLSWVETVKDESSPYHGQAIQREGYYLAFDFQAGKEDTKVSRDGYYSNWIIKITPGHFNPASENAKRVMSEDLGGSFDFDFNDVVFDVMYETYNGQSQAIISVQAAGGTMPIVVGHSIKKADKSLNQDIIDKYEIHKLLGDGSLNPINVGTGNNHEVSIYRVPVTTTNLKDIPISVKNILNGSGEWEVYTGQTNSYDNIENSGENKYDKPSSTIQQGVSDKLKAPRAFAVPLISNISITGQANLDLSRQYETRWMKECKCIHDTYYEFDNWVSDGKPATGQGMDGERGWWEQADKTENLFAKYVTTENGNPVGNQQITPSTWIPLHPQTDKKCYSDYYLNIDGYTGDDAIWHGITETNTQQITFTVVMELTPDASNTTPKVEAVLVPADVASNGTMSYKGNPFATPTSRTDMLDAINENDWQTAAESENRYRTSDKVRTYVCRFTFTKEQLSSTVGQHGVAQYIFLYIKATGGTVVIPAHPDVNNKSQWYIHY